MDSSHYQISIQTSSDMQRNSVMTEGNSVKVKKVKSFLFEIQSSVVRLDAVIISTTQPDQQQNV